MRIFDFILLSGYVLSGVDVAQGFRAQVFDKNKIDAKFIFIDVPTLRDIELYESKGMKRSQMMCAQLFMTEHTDMELSVTKEQLLEREKEKLEYDTINERNNNIQVYKSQKKIAEIKCDDRGYVIYECYYKDDKMYMANYYIKQLAYTELYAWKNSENVMVGSIERRIFWDISGQIAFEQIWIDNNVKYVFNSGKIIDSVEFTDQFVMALKLNENDICMMDRAGYFNFQSSLFKYKNGATLIGILHSDHYYKMYEDEGSLYMNYEYYHWFKYSDMIDYFVVGTEEHKQSLRDKLKEYNCAVPQIVAIPPGALRNIEKCRNVDRKPGSIISASRLNPRKGIDILIKGMIKAHKINKDIFLDIYGRGDESYTLYLNNLVKEASAESYIHFKGQCNMDGIYQNYEVFTSFSLWETFGLSLMEAVGDGLAMIGLDVRYGNRLFIHPGENGYIVDFDLEKDMVDKESLTDRVALAIVKIFEDQNRLERFHEVSYEIADDYKQSIIEDKWLQFIYNI